MTSDAKIGLLLGLIFIFVIAFVIKGLPKLSHGANNNELTTEMVRQEESSRGLGPTQREFIHQVLEVGPNNVPEARAEDSAERFRTSLPDGTLVGAAKEVTVEANEAESRTANAVDTKPIEVISGAASLPKTYVVCDGDSLAAIAKRVYGPDEGKKKANLDRIFEANRKLLRSEDEIFPGQKLIIPPLSKVEQGRSPGLPEHPLLEKAESIGKRHILPGSGQVAKTKEYVVQANDTLWQIAAKYLGDGAKYKELIKVNADILQDEDNLVPGMRLKLPSQ